MVKFDRETTFFWVDRNLRAVEQGAIDLGWPAGVDVIYSSIEEALAASPGVLRERAGDIRGNAEEQAAALEARARELEAGGIVVDGGPLPAVE